MEGWRRTQPAEDVADRLLRAVLIDLRTTPAAKFVQLPHHLPKVALIELPTGWTLPARRSTLPAEQPSCGSLPRLPSPLEDCPYYFPLFGTRTQHTHAGRGACADLVLRGVQPECVVERELVVPAGRRVGQRDAFRLHLYLDRLVLTQRDLTLVERPEPAVHKRTATNDTIQTKDHDTDYDPPGISVEVCECGGIQCAKQRPSLAGVSTLPPIRPSRLK